MQSNKSGFTLIQNILHHCITTKKDSESAACIPYIKRECFVFKKINILNIMAY